MKNRDSLILPQRLPRGLASENFRDSKRTPRAKRKTIERKTQRTYKQVRQTGATR